MNILTSVIVLLQFAVSFLTASIGTSLQPQATEFATQSIIIAKQALDEVQAQATPPPAISEPQTTNPTPLQTTPIINNETPMVQVKTQKSITIISPIPGKGLGREYLSRSQVKDEFNYIVIGLVVKDDVGEPVKNVEVVVTATDVNQNKTFTNTGNVTPIFVNGSKVKTPYYEFTYEFKTAGDHVITFVAEGLTESVTLSATEDTRP